ncbi:LysM peptidoglycan-binding domain-containing protein [Sporosarcina aquimarina]|uniref:SafA/ExsA family spore coat assembly protein n=1 Tax=Sporosarcina aquimarina TaxID=114975 RepID=A0ABU4FZS2_9BACL|nr:SafA/ExsA family spore coat assembly protein [Sporosarcina aquimarina]MDW0109622.1 SafA/ExsA family spore coat assembly protein [Sporosarcina aquimarina]
MNVHIVVKGDTLWKIARQYGISFEELKKVNAHLANPDYIVPGMKIFLPEGGKGGKKPEKHGEKEKHPQHHEKNPQPHEKHPQHHEKNPQPHEKHPQHHEKPVKPPAPAPPQHKPAPPKPEVKPIPPAPMPKPEVKPQPAPPKPQPKPEMKPQPKPELKPEMKPMPKPESPMCEVPPAAPAPPVQQPPIMQPMFIGVPCGWMPIYDADCHPHMHHMHHHYPPMQPPMQPQMPPMMPQEPMQPPQWQMPMESPEKCEDELPIMPGQGPGVSPNHCDSVQQWESPEKPMPKMESSHFDLSPPAYCPPEQGYIPQQMPQQWSPQQMPMQGIQAQQHPQYMHLCTSCGSNMHPMPYYGMPMMGVHPHYGGGRPPMNPTPYGPYDPNQMGSY